MWETKTKSRHRWQCGTVVRGGDARGRGRRFESRRPRSHEFYAKNAGDGWALAGGGLHRLKKIPNFFGFFSVPTLPSVGLCRVPDKRHSAKTPLPAHFLPSAALSKAFAECKLGWHSAKPLSSVVPQPCSGAVLLTPPPSCASPPYSCRFYPARAAT